MEIKYLVTAPDEASATAVVNFIGQLRSYVARRRDHTHSQLSITRGVTNTNLLNRELYVWDDMAEMLKNIEVKNGAK